MGDTVSKAITKSITGSLLAEAQSTGASLAETFLSCDVLVLVDVSASMHAADAGRGRTRYAAACDELANLQAVHPGKIGVIAFSTLPTFCPGGVPPEPSGGTDLTEALDYARVADGCGMQFIVISDGEPNNEHTALAAAKRYTSRIDTVFVGPEGGDGQAFLRRLAAASGGQGVTAAQTAQLAQTIERLMLAAG